MESNAIPTDEYLLLTGRPPIADFVRFMKRKSIGGETADDVMLAREWADANGRVRDVERTEAGFADTAEPPGLDSRIERYANEELARSTERSSLAFLPYRWAMVELDRLVVYQKFINLNFAEQILRSLPTHPSEEELIQTALGNMHRPPPIQVTQQDGNSFSFVSSSNDLRVLSVAPVDAKDIPEHRARHGTSKMLGVFVGYSSNVLKAVRIANRTVLTNGSHRAYALRKLGLTHVPCVVQMARPDQLELLGWSEMTQHIDQYLTAPRPSLFKDYFDERLYRLVPVHRRGQLIQVEVTIRESAVPCF
jgi:hypothetical protein